MGSFHHVAKSLTTLSELELTYMKKYSGVSHFFRECNTYRYPVLEMFVFDRERLTAHHFILSAWVILIIGPA